jgi:hypothetical protein
VVLVVKDKSGPEVSVVMRSPRPMDWQTLNTDHGTIHPQFDRCLPNSQIRTEKRKVSGQWPSGNIPVPFSQYIGPYSRSQSALKDTKAFKEGVCGWKEKETQSSEVDNLSCWSEAMLIQGQYKTAQKR